MELQDESERDEREEIEIPAPEPTAKPVRAVEPPVSSRQQDDEESGQITPSDTRNWYVIHCYSGYENKVRHNLEQRIETMDMKEKSLTWSFLPRKRSKSKRANAGRLNAMSSPAMYSLIRPIEESWYVVRNTPEVTGFVGMGNQPTALRPEEVSQILRRMEAEAPHIKVSFKIGERVRIVDGPFNDFRGTVSEIDQNRTKVRVMVNFFGRETPVELDFLQVEKA